MPRKCHSKDKIASSVPASTPKCCWNIVAGNPEQNRLAVRADAQVFDKSEIVYQALHSLERQRGIALDGILAGEHGEQGVAPLC
jgi:hypothetical protein